MLYIPANNRDWVESAPSKYDADGYIFDLEDSVPPSDKAEARRVLRDSLDGFGDTEKVITARVNAPDTGLFEADLEAIAHDRLDAIIVPKLPVVEDIKRADHVLTYLESVRDSERETEIIALPEAPQAMYRAFQLCEASDRVTAICGPTSQGADAERALGFRWTPDATERLYMLSKILLEARAAGLEQIFAGAWTDVDNTEGLREEAELVRDLGYTGYHVIHPSHIEVVNEVFQPDPDDVEHYRELMARLEAAEVEERRGAIRFEGEMIDIAHIRRAEQMLERARAFGMLE